MIGKRLGHYQITSQLGKGGMGEVFQAKDQVLGREAPLGLPHYQISYQGFASLTPGYSLPALRALVP